MLGLDSKSIPANNAVNQYAEALAKAWSEYDNPRSVQRKKFPLTFSSSSAAGFGSLIYFLTYPSRAVIMIVVQAEERNMYDQHFVSAVLREKYPFLRVVFNYNTKGNTFVLFPI